MHKLKKQQNNKRTESFASTSHSTEEYQTKTQEVKEYRVSDIASKEYLLVKKRLNLF